MCLEFKFNIDTFLLTIDYCIFVRNYLFIFYDIF